MGLDGTGWDGIGWDGAGRDGVGWDGMEWDGIESHCCHHLPAKEGHRRPVDPRVGGRCGHSLQIVLALFTMYAGTRELPVVSLDAIAPHSFLHLDEGIGRDLVAQSSGPGVDHYAHL